jgi:hypothetical protein
MKTRAWLLLALVLVGGTTGLVLRGPESGKPEENGRTEREDGALERAQLFLAKRLPAGETRLDAQRWFSAEKHMRSMARHTPERSAASAHAGQASLAAAPQWEWLGPGDAAGRTRTLIFHPNNPDILFAGGVSGGVWRSDDAGTHWRALSDDAVNLNIGSLLIDPADTQVMYAGTGELYRNSGMPWSPMKGAGILKSLDGGQSWSALLATQTDDFVYVADLVLSPHDSQRLYAATNSGVWRSDDGGAHFTQILRPADDAERVRYEGCNDLAIRSDKPGDWLLATCSSRSTADRYWLPDTVTPPACGANTPCPAAVFLNTDASGSGAWGQVLSEAGQGRTQMAIHRADQNVIYASAASIVPGFDRNGDGQGDYDNALHAVFRSDDGGASWHATLRNSDPDLLSSGLFQFHYMLRDNACSPRTPAYFYGAGWYNNAIVVDPLNPDTVWVGGMTVFRSDDGGHRFGLASYYYEDGTGVSYIHPDQHALLLDPRFDGVNNQRLYSTNDGGVAVTDNARAPVSFGDGALCTPRNGNRVAWRSLVDGLSTTQFYGGAVTPDGHSYFGGTQDNGTWLGNDVTGPSAWRHIYGGDGGYTAVDPTNPRRLYATSQYMTLGRSEDGGNSFEDAIDGFDDTTLFMLPYLIDPNSPNRLYAGGTRLWRSDDYARSWWPASAAFDGPGFGRRVSSLAVAPGDPNRLLAGNLGGIFRNTNALASGAGTLWSMSAPRPGWVSRVAFDPHDHDVAYATYSTYGGVHVWKSVDAGASWEPLDGSGEGTLPDVPVHVIAIDPVDTQRLYLGTDLGLFVSLDGGTHWAVENTGFANVITEDLVVNTPTGGGAPQLYAFTYGRGVWRTPLAQLTGTADYRIDARVSGMWVVPDQDGHGLVLEAIALDGVTNVIASWFVYVDGKPIWLIGVGRAENNRVHVVFTSANGADFPPAFDPARVQHADWGSIDLTFDSDHSGQLQWTSPLAAFGSGTLPLTQLIRADLPGADPAGAVTKACHSGNWFNPAQSGHGIFLDVFHIGEERQLMTVWYVYDHGQPIFLVGAGPIDGDHANVTLGTSRGPQFPPNFRTTDLIRSVWGSATVRFVDNDHASIDWTPQVSGFSAGHLDLTRLTTQIGRACN